MHACPAQLYYALRSGYEGAAKRAAERCHDPRASASGFGASGSFAGSMGMGAASSAESGSFKPYIEEWMRNGGRLSDRCGTHRTQAATQAAFRHCGDPERKPIVAAVIV